MFIGIDLGTSAVKVILLGEKGELLATSSEPLNVSRPYPLWSEQDPKLWWQATDRAMRSLRSLHRLDAVMAIGLSGQMHGATLLDKQNKVLRPAILWNDGRSSAECELLQSRITDALSITGNLLMPGFTAPKLLWLAKHEPEVFSLVAKILLPKDYLRWCMSGDFATDMSDAAGTMWLDVRQRCWSETMLEACQLTTAQMPKLYEGTQITGQLSTKIARRWHMPAVPLVAGGGDNAAGAVGAGIVDAGQTMLSLGTSGVYFAATSGYLARPESTVHSFCHALPQRWHLMSVMLSAASCFDWATRLTGLPGVADLVAAAQNASDNAQSLWFLPYLCGERTPHNNPKAKGVFFGLTHQHGPAELARAVLEGVGYALADGIDAVNACGIRPDSVILIGGGARSHYWRQMLADISGLSMDYCTGGDVGPALGAARLAQIALTPQQSLRTLLPELPLQQRHQPNDERFQYYVEQRHVFRQIYQQLYPLMC